MPFSSASSGEVSRISLPRRRNVPAIRVVDAGDDLHQRRLAGAVLAHQRVHRAGLQAELRHRPARRRPGIPCGRPRPPAGTPRVAAGAVLRPRRCDASRCVMSRLLARCRQHGAGRAGPRAPRPRVGSVLGQILVHVGRGDQLERDPDHASRPSRPWPASAPCRPRPGPAPAAFWNTVTSRSPAFMAASASCVASTPADDDLAHVDAGRLERLDGADRHFVVVGDHRVELDAGADPVGHQIGALGALPVAGLLLDDLDAGAFGRGDHVVDVLGALARRLVGQLAHHAPGCCPCRPCSLQTSCISSVPESLLVRADERDLRRQLDCRPACG